MHQEDIIVRPQRLRPLETENATFRSMYDFKLTERDFEQATSELGETEEIKKTSLKILKARLSNDEKVWYRTDDNYLLRYLRWRKFDTEKAYYSIKKFYNLRSHSPDFFCLPPNLESLLNMNAVRPLPYRDENGSIIFWVDTKNWNLEEMSCNNLFLCSNVVSDVVSMNPCSQVNSIIGLWDVGGLTARHYAQCFSYRMMVTIIQCLQDSHPWRLKRVLIFNCSHVIRTVYRLIISKISKKMADRMVFLGSDVKELHQYINPSILPKCYEGSIEEDECGITELIMDNAKYLEYEHSFISKRNGK